jgi:hypothetical protein
MLAVREFQHISEKRLPGPIWNSALFVSLPVGKITHDPIEKDRAAAAKERQVDVAAIESQVSGDQVD